MLKRKWSQSKKGVRTFFPGSKIPLLGVVCADEFCPLFKVPRYAPHEYIQRQTFHSNICEIQHYKVIIQMISSVTWHIHALRMRSTVRARAWLRACPDHVICHVICYQEEEEEGGLGFCTGHSGLLVSGWCFFWDISRSKGKTMKIFFLWDSQIMLIKCSMFQTVSTSRLKLPTMDSYRYRYSPCPNLVFPVFRII